MLKKRVRLTSEEVKTVLSEGRSVSVQPEKGQKTLISAKFIAKTGVFKVAAVAPKSVAKGAVDRNKLRRAVYRAVSSLPSPKKAGVIVFFVRSIPKGPFTPAFTVEIKAIFDKISAY